MTDKTRPAEASSNANCGKCGLCLAACPVYQALKEEQASPRARLQLIKAFENQTLLASPLLKELISKCLMCGSCARACPSGINHYAQFIAMREKMVAQMGETPAIRTLIYLMAREYRLRAGARMARTGQKLTPAALARTYKLGNIPVDRFPDLNAKPFRQTLPGRLAADPRAGTPRGRVAYFTGCATQYMFADTGRATTGLLTWLGYEVVIPALQTCCSLPLLFHGARDKAAQNIAANIQALSAEPVDWILVDCSTCGAALKDEYPAFAQKAAAKERQWQPLAKAAQGIASRTRDIMGFLHDHQDVLEYKPAPENRPCAVYHAPCHSRNSFDTHPKVQDLLGRLPALAYLPTPGESDCCGGGGTFFYEYPGIARQMMEKKQNQIRSSRADLWLTDCPVCRINLAGNLDANAAVRVTHPVIPIFDGVVKSLHLLRYGA